MKNAISFIVAVLVVATIAISTQSMGQLNNPGITSLVGDCSASGSGSVPITCTKSSGVSFAQSATVDATNANNISAGTLANGRLATGAAVANLGFTPLSPANNLSDLATPVTARTNLGLGSAATQASSAFDAAGTAATAQSASLQKTSNLSDLATPATARTNLGLGTLATQSASSVAITGGSIAGASVKVPSSTVALLPTCNAGSAGTIALVIDALTPVYLTALTGGGSAVAFAICTGIAWVGA